MSRCARVPVALLAIAMAPAALSQPKLADFLYSLGPGPVSASEIIKLDANAVSSIQSTRDLVLSLGNLGDEGSKKGFGLSFSPARSQFDALAIPLARYADPEDWFARAWGGTTFSYATNKLDQGGVEYTRDAWAVSTSFYWHAEHDPVIAARNAVAADLSSGSGSCAAIVKAFAGKQVETLALARDFKLALGFGDGDEAPKWLVDWANAVVRNEAPPKLHERAGAILATVMQRHRSVSIKAPDPAAFAADLRACVEKARNEARKKWNASQAKLVLAQGTIRPVAGTGERLSLGRHAFASLNWAPPRSDNHLLTLTLRRASRELDLDTLGQTAVFKSTTVAALRYTYGTSGRDTYALAEVSNVKGNDGRQSNQAFKQAVGIDHKLGAGLWLEFRYGRARTVDGSKVENKSLLAVKFSPQSGLDEEIK